MHTWWKIFRHVLENLWKPSSHLGSNWGPLTLAVSALSPEHENAYMYMRIHDHDKLNVTKSSGGINIMLLSSQYVAGYLHQMCQLILWPHVHTWLTSDVCGLCNGWTHYLSHLYLDGQMIFQSCGIATLCIASSPIVSHCAHCVCMCSLHRWGEVTCMYVHMYSIYLHVGAGKWYVDHATFKSLLHIRCWDEDSSEHGGHVAWAWA